MPLIGHTGWHILTIMHERLDSPEMSSHDKVGEIAGNVSMGEELRELHLLLHLLQLLHTQHLQVNESQHCEQPQGLMLGYQDGGHP